MHIDISITKDTIYYILNVVLPQFAIGTLLATGIIIGAIYVWERYFKGGD